MRQGWLSDFLAKEKHVAGVKDEPKEAEDVPAAPVEANDAAATSEGKLLALLHTCCTALTATFQPCAKDLSQASTKKQLVVAEIMESPKCFTHKQCIKRILAMGLSCS